MEANKYKSGQNEWDHVWESKSRAFIWTSNLNIQSKKKTTEETTQCLMSYVTMLDAKLKDGANSLVHNI